MLKEVMRDLSLARGCENLGPDESLARGGEVSCVTTKCDSTGGPKTAHDDT